MKTVTQIGCCVLWVLGTLQAAAAEITYDFRSHSYDPAMFLQTGPGASTSIRSEKQGLRITLPPEHARKPAVGVVLRSGFQGDFEITMDYELLQVDEPTGGSGAGVTIWITMVSYTKEAATIGRMLRKENKPVFTSHRATTPDGGSRKHFGGEPIAALASKGKLRFVRSGSKLSYRVSDGSSDEFREIFETELGSDDVDTVRFAADNGGSPTLVDVLIKSIKIQSEDAGPPQELAPRRSRWPLIIWSTTAMLIVVAGGWSWVRLRE